jgi:hypothetical protein
MGAGRESCWPDRSVSDGVSWIREAGEGAYISRSGKNWLHLMMSWDLVRVSFILGTQ